jgi:amidase
MDDEPRSGIPTIEACGDESLKTNVRFMPQGVGETDRDGYLDGLLRRHAIARASSSIPVSPSRSALGC